MLKLFPGLVTCLAFASTGVIAAATLGSPINNVNQPAARAVPPGALWGDNNAPDPLDMRKSNGYSTSLLSGLIALMHVDQGWIKKMVTFEGDAATVDKVTVNFYDPTTLAPKSGVVTKKQVEEWPLRPDAKEGWWVGAVNYAIWQAGYGMWTYPHPELQTLTGRKVTLYRHKDAPEHTMQGSTPIDVEAFWALIKAAETTPVVYQTPYGDGCGGLPLPCETSWAIEGGHGGNEAKTRWVTLISDEGARSTWDVDTVYRQLDLIYGFAQGATEKP